MGRCDECKRTDIKCCTTCSRNGATCNVWHKCGEDCKEYKKKTNADRIRAMSDEELAEFIDNYRPEHIANDWCLNLCPDRKDGDCDCPYGGYETALGWLKSEAKENN